MSWLDTAVVTWMGDAVSVSELLGFITGALCVWLVVRQHVANFPIGMLNAGFFLILFYQVGLYADGALQLVYLALNAAGWYAWRYGGQGRTPRAVTRSSLRLLVGIGAFIVLATGGFYILLVRINDSAPFWDALTTALSLAAQYLLNLKKLESWWLWITADIIYIPLYVYKDLNLTALVYILFLGLCVAGLIGWKKALNQAIAPIAVPAQGGAVAAAKLGAP